MRKFSLILPDKVDEFKRFFWATQREQRLGLLVWLIGIKVGGREISTVYQPVFTFEKLSDGVYLEIHFSRWSSYVILINKSGFHGRWFDIRKGSDKDIPK
jgi:hypothetical protein